MTNVRSEKRPAIKDMTLKEVVDCYEGGSTERLTSAGALRVEKRLITRGLALAKTKSDLNQLLQAVLSAHEAAELMPNIFAQIMPIMKRVEELPRRERRLTNFRF